MTDEGAAIRWHLFPSEDVARAICAVAPVLSDADLWDALREQWTRCEAHAPYRALLLEAFRRAKRARGTVTDSHGIPLAGVLTIYRGNMGEAEPAGISWTLDLGAARMFARWAFSPRAAYLRGGLQGLVTGALPTDAVRPTVWRARVNAGDVLGHFVERNEAEVVVDPGLLWGVELIEALTKEG